MTTEEILALRAQGQTELAYEAARQLFATDKGAVAASTMFWTAVDMLRWKSGMGDTNEAKRILLALERLYSSVPNPDGEVTSALQQCQQLMEKAVVSPPPDKEEAKHTQMGRWGEQVAECYLYGKGYDIVEQDWHSGHRDIDIIAQRGDLYVFVEVKTRRNRVFGDPMDAIDSRKRYNLRRAITHYVCHHHIDHFRFDIITVVGSLHCPEPEIVHVENVQLMELATRPRGKRR